MTENEAIEALKLEGGIEITGRPIRLAQFFEGIDSAIKALEEVQQYRTIGTPEECQTAMEQQNVNKELESHDEKQTLECCISLMQEMVNEFAEWYRWQHGEDAIE